jgi:phosphoadenosine phosphosulfate reductase
MYKGLNRYQHFGYRQVWLQDYLTQGNELFATTTWGKYQYESMKVWFREALIMGSNNLLPLGEFIKALGAENNLGWAFMWVNLSYNSALMRWFVTNIFPGARVSKNDMLAMFGSMYARDTIMNALTSLFETMEKSPIGDELGQGVCQKKGKIVQNIYRKGWLDVEPLAILYALYQFAEHEEGRYSFTLEQLDNSEVNGDGLTPQQIFAIDTSLLRSTILGLIKDYPDYIQADMAMGLDNIRLSDVSSSGDILALY